MPRFLFVILAALQLAACTRPPAPSIYAFGAYFPSWLLCAVVGIVAAVLVRFLFIRLGLEDFLPARLLVYTSVAVIVALGTSLIVFEA